MSNRFIKFIPGPEADFLRTKPIAFVLLSLIAERARRETGHPDGLEPGEAYIGDWDAIGASEQEYRTAKKHLVLLRHIEIVETCRTRKKSLDGNTTRGTKVRLISRSIFDINIDNEIFYENSKNENLQKSNDRHNDQKQERKNSEINDRPNDRPTTDQRPTNDEQERRRTKKEGIKKGTIVKEEKIVRPSFRSPPSYQEDLKELNETAVAMGWDIDSKDFGIWLKKYEKAKIIQHLTEMDRQKYKIRNHARWMQSALDQDYIGQKAIIEKNRQYAENFKKQYNWRSLTIRKKYCRNEDSQNEYYFYHFDPELFAEHLKNEFKTKENLA